MFKNLFDLSLVYFSPSLINIDNVGGQQNSKSKDIKPIVITLLKILYSITLIYFLTAFLSP
jgi:hypothetical protein